MKHNHHQAIATMAIEWTIISAPVVTIVAQNAVAKMRKRRKGK